MEKDGDDRTARWPVRLFFTGVVLFAAAGVFYFIHGDKDPRWDWRVSPARTAADYTGASSGDKILLQKDRDCMMRQLKLVYRGAEGDRLRFDATLLQLDPDYAYVHRIEPDFAENGFHMGGHTFRLLTWSGSEVSLELLQ